MTATATGNAAWVERNTGLTLTADQRRCVDVLCSIARPYNLPLIDGGWRDVATTDDGGWTDVGEDAPERPPVVIHPLFVIARLRSEMATYDGAELTRLVIAAHDAAVRVSIRTETYRQIDRDSFLSRWSDVQARWVETDEHPASDAPCLTVILHARQRDGSLFERHPTIEQAVAAIRGEDR